MGSKFGNTSRLIQEALNQRGNRAKRLWSMASIKGGDPSHILDNLKNLGPMLASEFRDEAKQLARDVENILKNPPLP